MKEYKVLMADSLISEDQLNQKSEEGWDLIAIAQMDGKYYFYFKHEKHPRTH